MKNIIIKIWPEVNGYIPITIPLPNIKKRKNDLFFDFSNCTSVNSTGLTMLLSKVLKMLISSNAKRQWDSNFNLESKVFSKILYLNFFKIIDQYLPSNNIFYQNKVNRLGTQPVSNLDFDNDIKSFPIYVFDFRSRKSNKRKFVYHFRKWLYEILNSYSEKYDFHLTQLISVLSEMAKNSADHTSENAYFGLDIFKKNTNNLIELTFSFCDLGIGIKKTIENHYSHQKVSKGGHGGLSDSYHRALTPGMTTKPDSGLNKGIGMSIILEGSKRIGLELSVFDARCRGILSNFKTISHSDIRQHFYNIGKEVGFCYFGKLIAKRM